VNRKLSRVTLVITVIGVAATLAQAHVITDMAGRLEWGGQRHFVLIRGSRRVELTLGSHAVTIGEGGDTKMVFWALCPRLLNGISYAPVRPLAKALGLGVSFSDSVVTLQDKSGQ